MQHALWQCVLEAVMPDTFQTLQSLVVRNGCTQKKMLAKYADKLYCSIGLLLYNANLECIQVEDSIRKVVLEHMQGTYVMATFKWHIVRPLAASSSVWVRPGVPHHLAQAH